jgi:hypothetical protein
MNPGDVLQAVEPVVEAFEKLGVQYRVVGSLASTAFGVARMTADADLVADLHVEHVDDLVNALAADYYIDSDVIREAIQSRSGFNVIHLPTSLKVDVFVLADTAYDRQAFPRLTMKSLDPAPGSRAYALATPEDTVLAKLRWYKAGREVSERQWQDIVGVMKLQQRRLQIEYLQEWAQRLGLANLLSKALSEAGLEV